MPSSAYKISTKFKSLGFIAAIALNVIFAVQAIMFDWTIGTLVWVYWAQGVAIVLLSLITAKIKFGWILLLALLLFYSIFLSGLTFPSDGMTYVINGEQVSPERFTIFRDTQWSAVLINVLILMLEYALFFISREKGSKATYPASSVVKRIIPLHMIILLAMFARWPVILFIVLKTAFDLIAEAFRGLSLHKKSGAIK